MIQSLYTNLIMYLILAPKSQDPDLRIIDSSQNHIRRL
ncbi:hypothetical protein LEP1GSC060_1888 [Leptospira weilii serovar Ranarum str. ICFT]|uniref:Uncharacterized protein n=1 Tax=Leptospira weilii serovar Ranarum str. ICFT TaxID=1218598 RepID=N1WMP2_9LEPT|nr:hypothetical protein LEP1GSC060_1888 [Leptospira weilii serovar Ranarum str. ICFT]